MSLHKVAGIGLKLIDKTKQDYKNPESDLRKYIDRLLKHEHQHPIKTASTGAMYFIGVPTGVGQEHMTLKALGRLTEQEARAWARNLDQLKTVEKFPMVSKGLGMLGKHKTHLVNFLHVDPRIKSALNMLGSTVAKQPPHVTVHGLGKAGRFPVNTGPINTMSTVTAQEVHLYKVTGTNYAPVHTVKLRKRNPITWIKDSLGLNKYAKEEKMALSELGFHKTAFWGVSPFKVKNKEEWKSVKGHLKEQANTAVGFGLGTAAGVLGGSMLGGVINPHVGRALGVGAGAAGGIVGTVKSLRKTEREAKVKQTDLGQYIARYGASFATDAALRAVNNNPMSFAPAIAMGAADYVISRKLQEH
jgi:2'-5' RNA ligase